MQVNCCTFFLFILVLFSSWVRNPKKAEENFIFFVGKSLFYFTIEKPFYEKPFYEMIRVSHRVWSWNPFLLYDSQTFSLHSVNYFGFIILELFSLMTSACLFMLLLPVRNNRFVNCSLLWLLTFHVYIAAMFEFLMMTWFH